MSADRVAFNAAKIGIYVADDGSSTGLADKIVAAAQLLHTAESGDGFDWENKERSWEDTCYWLANRLCDRQAVTLEGILTHINMR